MTNIAIDSDVIVASQIENEGNHAESKKFMDFILTNKINELYYFTSIFTFLELASAMIRRTKDQDKAYSLLYKIRTNWKEMINPLPLLDSKKALSSKAFSTNLIDKLIETSIKFGTKSGDTIQAQAIVENQIDFFVTWNKKDFIELEKQIPNFKVLTPTEMFDQIIKMKEIKDK